MHTSPETSGATPVQLLQSKLAPFGYADVLKGLPDDADERHIMGRLVEMGPGMTPDGDVHTEKVPSDLEFKARVAAAAVITNATYRTDLLAPVNRHAFDPSSPLRMPALRALAEIDPAARSMLTIEDRKAANEAAKTRTAVHRCIHCKE